MRWQTDKNRWHNKHSIIDKTYKFTSFLLIEGVFSNFLYFNQGNKSHIKSVKMIHKKTVAEGKRKNPTIALNSVKIERKKRRNE